MGVVTSIVLGVLAAAGTISTAVSRQAASKRAEKLQEETLQAQQAEQVKTQETIATAAKENENRIAKLQEAPEKAVEEVSRVKEIKRRAQLTKTLLTTPQGDLSQANVGKKVLLGS